VDLREDPGEATVGRVRTTSAEETEALGARIAAGLRPGDVVLVAGELGAGKTTLVRGACRALGVTAPVTSPTFTIGQRYDGAVPVAHLDLFRVESLDAEEPGLLADYIDPGTIGFVEWPPDRLADGVGTLRVARRVEIVHAGGDERLIEVRS
jgi:tRNA threonylcarbamoyladenosine biosynthesis protein TsaE